MSRQVFNNTKPVYRSRLTQDRNQESNAGLGEEGCSNTPLNKSKTTSSRVCDCRAHGTKDRLVATVLCNLTVDRVAAYAYERKPDGRNNGGFRSDAYSCGPRTSRRRALVKLSCRGSPRPRKIVGPERRAGTRDRVPVAAGSIPTFGGLCVPAYAARVCAYIVYAICARCTTYTRA